MIPELGHYALVLALVVALVLAVVPALGARRGDAALMAVGEGASLAGLGLVGLAFACLASAYLDSDFSVANVAANSHTLAPSLFKFTATWGNHEGSMLLWVLVMALVTAGLAAFGTGFSPRLKAYALACQGAIQAMFLVFILATSNPFARLDPAPFEGRGLNPVLQDLGLALHPPILYTGYVGFSVAFSLAVGALLEGRVDPAFARAARPWTLVAWAFLTVGIAAGSYWAYYELGWGGFWFWDPVENASLLPWLAGTALIHSVLVMERRDALKVWTVLLAILTFSLSLLGAFLTRSGVLTSVHSFAADPARGVAILMILAVVVGGSLSLFAARAGALKAGGLFAPISREGALVFNNLALCAVTASVLVGTLYPLVLEAVGAPPISVGPPYFEATAVPIAMGLLLAVPVGGALAWKRGDLAAAGQRVAMAGLAAFFAAAAVLAWTRGGPVLAALGVGLGAFLILGSASDLHARARGRGVPARVALRRFTGLPLATFGAALAHAGVGLTVLGVSATAWNGETLALMRPGDVREVGPFALRLDAVAPRPGPNYRDSVAAFTVTRDGAPAGRTEASKRSFVTGQSTSEAGLRTFGFSQLYVSLGEGDAEGRVGVRLFWKPWVLLIWLGALVMALGGALALADRRVKVGAPSRARRVRAELPVAAE